MIEEEGSSDPDPGQDMEQPAGHDESGDETSVFESVEKSEQQRGDRSPPKNRIPEPPDAHDSSLFL